MGHSRHEHGAQTRQPAVDEELNVNLERLECGSSEKVHAL